MHMYGILLLLLACMHLTYPQQEVEINLWGENLSSSMPSSSSSSFSSSSFSPSFTSASSSSQAPRSSSTTVPTFVTENVPWSPSLLTNFTRCTIPRVPYLSTEEFQRIYKGRLPVIYSRPLTVTNLFRTLTTYTNLLENFGSYGVTLASSNSYSHDKYRTTLRDYLITHMQQSTVPDRSAKDTYYWFGDEMDDFRSNLLDKYPLPLDTSDNDGLSVFGCGNQYSGVAFHTHGAAHAEIIHGRKRWYVSSPSYVPRFDGDTTVLQWLLQNTPIVPSTYGIDASLSTQDDQILECTIEEGEIIYIPPNWWHATFNLDPYNVFVSVFTLEHLSSSSSSSTTTTTTTGCEE